MDSIFYYSQHQDEINTVFESYHAFETDAVQHKLISIY